MKTYEMLKFNKVYYVMLRNCGMAQGRECFAKKGDAEKRVRELKRAGYVEA